MKLELDTTQLAVLLKALDNMGQDIEFKLEDLDCRVNVEEAIASLEEEADIVDVLYGQVVKALAEDAVA